MVNASKCLIEVSTSLNESIRDPSDSAEGKANARSESKCGGKKSGSVWRGGRVSVASRCRLDWRVVSQRVVSRSQEQRVDGHNEKSARWAQGSGGVRRFGLRVDAGPG